GYRSPQARQLADAEETPFTKVRSADLGARFSPTEALNLSLSAYQTNLSDDVAFEASEGRLERVGATRRRGGVVHLEARPWAGSIVAASVTYVDAELLEPPPATADEPNPPFKAGQNLPFVPALVARLDLGVERELTQVAHDALQARVGLGLSALSARPLPFGDYARPFALVDASLAFDCNRFTIGLEMFNVMDTQYSATEYSYVSHWDPAQPPSRVPARHVSAGSPRT